MYESLETERLILKNIDQTDSEFLLEEYSDPEIHRYFFDAEPLICVEQAQGIIEFYLEPEPRAQHRYIIQKKDDYEKIGTIGFHCLDFAKKTVEIGYDLKPEFRKQGFMEESLRALLEYARNRLPVEEVRACIYIDNIDSEKTVRKFGFQKSGMTYELYRGEKYLHNIFSYYFSQK